MMLFREHLTIGFLHKIDGTVLVPHANGGSSKWHSDRCSRRRGLQGGIKLQGREQSCTKKRAHSNAGLQEVEA
ncbi:unnamed protein product [Nezara viridula]|uniref:Uncharacterized protein n=1 Tax=Nezara viridula TaxID=85310 RepID=A0A9P0MTC6_NEZVI|nr:unnamed protein product [Nezara viridula]